VSKAMGEKKKKNQNYELAFTHLQNNQNISAYNLFMELAEAQKKIDSIKAALLYIIAAECKSRQKKDNDDETLEAGKLFLNFAKKEDNYTVKSAYLCAAKCFLKVGNHDQCFLKVGNHDQAKKAYEQSKKLLAPTIESVRPVVIVEDSKAVILKVQSYLKKLGYNDTISFESGKDAIKGCKELFKNSKNPIILLDMGLPDVEGDVVASKILEEKLDSQIILITADEKTSKRVSKTISSGVTAFIQKPFTINDVKDAMETVESEYSGL
jgi:CheY-like chemotaxis protein